MKRISVIYEVGNYALWWLLYSVSRKKETKVFYVVPVTKLGWFWLNLTQSFLNKFVAKCYKCFPPHLNNVSTLSCETWNAYRACSTIECYRKNLQDLSYVSCGLHVYQIWSKLITVYGDCSCIAKEGVQNTYHWSGRTETATESIEWTTLDYVVIAAAIRPFDSSKSTMHVLCTCSCNIFHMLLSTDPFKCGKFGGQS